MRWIPAIALAACSGQAGPPPEIAVAPTAPSGPSAPAAQPAPATTAPDAGDPRPRVARPAALPDPPEGDFTPFTPPPDDPAFAELPDGWWKRGSPCPRGSTLRTRRGRPGGEDELTEHACVCRGKGEGPWVTLSAGGSRLEDGWQRGGEHHGLRREFSGGAPRFSRTYVDGVEHGWNRALPGDGQVRWEVPYRDGKRHGRAAFETAHGYREIGWYVDGKRHGAWVGTYEDGTTLVFRAVVEHDLLHGEQVVWDRDGVVLAHARFDHGTGTWTMWRPSGEVRATIECRGGELARFELAEEPTMDDVRRRWLEQRLAWTCRPHGGEWITDGALGTLWPTDPPP